MSILQRFFLFFFSTLFLAPTVLAAGVSYDVCHSANEDRIEIEILALKLSPAITHLDRHNDGLLVNGVCQSRQCSVCLLAKNIEADELEYIEQQRNSEVGQLEAERDELCDGIRPTEPRDPNDLDSQEAWARYEQCIQESESVVMDLDDLWAARADQVLVQFQLSHSICRSDSDQTTCALNLLAEEVPCGQAYNSEIAAAGDGLASCYSPPKGDVSVAEFEPGQNTTCALNHANRVNDANTAALACFQAAAANYNSCLSWPSACPLN